MKVYVQLDGDCRSVYDESLNLSELGAPSIRRASHVEPTSRGEWLADLSPVGGPRLGPFTLRSEALQAEQVWLAARLEEGGFANEAQ